MLLRLIEVEGDYRHERDLPDSEDYTIGRGGDVRPTIDASNLLSRIAVTIHREGSRAVVSWLVVNGSESGPSKSGLWLNESEMVSEYTLSQVGQSIDLIRPTHGLPTIKIMVASEYRIANEFSRDTTGFELEMLATIHEEISAIKLSARDQEKFREERRKISVLQIQEILDIKKTIIINNESISELKELLRSTIATNKSQDKKISISSWIIKGLVAAVIVGLTTAMVDAKNRELILQSTAGILLTGCTVVIASKDK